MMPLNKQVLWLHTAGIAMLAYSCVSVTAFWLQKPDSILMICNCFWLGNFYALELPTVSDMRLYCSYKSQSELSKLQFEKLIEELLNWTGCSETEKSGRKPTWSKFPSLYFRKNIHSRTGAAFSFKIYAPVEHSMAFP